MTNLEPEVTNLELSKRLEELGYPQESLWYWAELSPGNYAGKTHSLIRGTEAKEGNVLISAPTVAELGERLPSKIYQQEQEPYHLLGGCKDDVGVWYYDYSIGGKRLGGEMFTGENEADARATLLIYLMENGLVEVKK